MIRFNLALVLFAFAVFSFRVAESSHDQTDGGERSVEDIKYRVMNGYHIYMLASVLHGGLTSKSYRLVLPNIQRCVDAMDGETLARLSEEAPAVAEFVHLQIGLHQHYHRFSKPPSKYRNYTDLFKYAVPLQLYRFLRNKTVPFPYYSPDNKEEQQDAIMGMLMQTCPRWAALVDGIDKDMINEKFIKIFFAVLTKMSYVGYLLNTDGDPTELDKNDFEDFARGIQKGSDHPCYPSAGIYPEMQSMIEALAVSYLGIPACPSTLGDDPHYQEQQEAPGDEKATMLINAADSFFGEG